MLSIEYRCNDSRPTNLSFSMADAPDTAAEDDWNSELAGEVAAEDVSSLIVYSRDWTIETIVSQILKGNIDLNPSFQRRNAWNDAKRSKLIESLIVGVPVPEIVLAEDKNKPKSFIVIDGKQRLLAIAGFAEPNKYPIWSKPNLRGLTTRPDLNLKSYLDLTVGEEESPELRQLLNSDMRCTVISNYKTDQVLYDIFYRLNTGSVPLSSQELRQVLNKGPFADYLIQTTNVELPVHSVLNLKGPDTRLRDAEILLRYIAFSLFGSEYTGNLTPFLDSKMGQINSEWVQRKPEIERLTAEFNVAAALLIEIMPTRKVGRKYLPTGWESQFNRALFEVETYYYSRIDRDLALSKKAELVDSFKSLCLNSAPFIDSIETSTKNIQKYYTRYSLFQGMINETLGTSIDSIPVPSRD